MLRLSLQDSNQVAVGHRRERVILHARIRKQLVTDKQVAAKHGTTSCGKGRANDGKVSFERIHQGIGNRPDIAFIGRIKGRTHLKVAALCALGLQPLPGLQGHSLGLKRIDGSRFQGDNHRIGLGKKLLLIERLARCIDKAFAFLGQP